MNELVHITQHNGKQAVSARELHTRLEVKRDFTTWCKQMFDYGFQEDKDFSPIRGGKYRRPTNDRLCSDA